MMKYEFVQYASCVAYEPELFATKKEAMACASEWVRETRKHARHKLTQVGSFHELDKVELKIGGRQGYHTYATATVNKL